MKELLDSILERIATIPELKYVDEDWGQLDDYENPPAKFPLALIDLDVSEWNNLGNLSQTAEVRIGVTLCTMRLSNSSKAAPATQRQKAFEIFALLDGLQGVLQGWCPTGGNRMMRRSTTKRDTLRGLKAYRVEYVCRIGDDIAARRPQTTVQAAPVISIEP
jgi:hypothetical protein